MQKPTTFLGLLLISPLSWLVGCSESDDPSPTLSAEELGRELFFDRNLSKNRTQSCATCHDPGFAFVDSRPGGDGQASAGSLGDDGTSLGDRNAPTAAYARFTPVLSQGTRERWNTDGDIGTYRGYLGGLFLDGRAANLTEQASGPPLNPLEMGMKNERAVVQRLLENPNYEVSFEALYGAEIWDDARLAYGKMAEAIGEFERTSDFAPFDSRYDRSLLSVGDERRYTYHPASKAAEGKALFFSAEFTNCAACHQLHAQAGPRAREELFTGFEYHNLGVPENTELRARNKAGKDLGLAAVVADDEQSGKFKTPTLRNVAVTPPYMHNGVFRELSTVIRFYEHARRRARGEKDNSKNPESGRPWAEPEIAQNLSEAELGNGSKDLQDEEHVQALVCFLMTLTDAGFEHLLDEEKLRTCGIP